MARGDDNDRSQSPRYETPTFDPRGAFSWTLRGGERARLDARQQRNGLRDRKTPESMPRSVEHGIDPGANTTGTAPCETPTFDPRGAFSWTLRAGEIARRKRHEQRHRLPDPKQPDVLVVS